MEYLQTALFGDIRLDACAPTVALIGQEIDCIALEQHCEACRHLLRPRRRRGLSVVERIDGFVSERPYLRLRLCEFLFDLFGRQVRNFAADVDFHSGNY